MKIRMYYAELFGGERIPLASSKEKLPRKEIHKQLLLYAGSKALSEEIKRWKEETNPPDEKKAIVFSEIEYEIHEDDLSEEDINYRIEDQAL